MDDRIFFGVLFYLIASVSLVGLMPSDFYTGTSYTSETEGNIRSTIDSGSPTTSITENLNFMQKMLTFLFVTWSISGIPAFFSLIILILNIFSIVIIVIWIYDKVRGIGS